MKLKTIFFSTCVILLITPFVVAQNSIVLDNGVRIHAAAGVETRKEKPRSSSPVVIAIDEMDLIQAFEMLTILRSKIDSTEVSDKQYYRQQLLLVEDRIRKLKSEKN